MPAAPPPHWTPESSGLLRRLMKSKYRSWSRCRAHSTLRMASMSFLSRLPCARRASNIAKAPDQPSLLPYFSYKPSCQLVGRRRRHHHPPSPSPEPLLSLVKISTHPFFHYPPPTLAPTDRALPLSSMRSHADGICQNQRLHFFRETGRGQGAGERGGMGGGERVTGEDTSCSRPLLCS